jgi:hypothetical protein
MLEPCLGRHEHKRAAVPNGSARHAPESIVPCPCLVDGTVALSGMARQARGPDRAVPNRAVPGPCPCRAVPDRPFGKLYWERRCRRRLRHRVENGRGVEWYLSVTPCALRPTALGRWPGQKGQYGVPAQPPRPITPFQLLLVRDELAEEERCGMIIA